VTAVRTGGASTIDSVVRLPAGQRAAAVLGVLLVVAVLTGGAVYAARDYFAVQSDMVNAMSATSRVMLQGTRESVRARDVQGAVRVLSGFAIVTGVRVRLACLYDSQGRLFAERNWPAEGEAAVLACPPQPPRDSVEWGRDWMGFTADVIGSPPDGKQSLHLVLDEPRDTAKKWRVALGMGTAWLIVVGALGVAGIAWVVRRVRSRNEPRT
jgi:hypothetical protein